MLKPKEVDLEREDILDVMRRHHGILGATGETDRGWEIRLAVNFPMSGGPFDCWVPTVYPDRDTAGARLRDITERVADHMEQVGLRSRQEFHDLLAMILGGH